MNLETKFYDKHGIPINIKEFVKLRLNPTYSTIKLEKIGRDFLIILTWTGYTVINSDKPLIFDVTIFDLRGGTKYNFHVEKASSLEEALEIFDFLKVHHPQLTFRSDELTRFTKGDN